MAVSVWGKRLHTKTSLPLGKRYLPMGKRVGVTTTIIVPLVCGFRRQDLLAWHESFANFYELKSLAFVKFRQNIPGIMTNESMSANFDI